MKFLASLLALNCVSAATLAAQQIPVTSENGGTNRAFTRWRSGSWQVLAGPDYCAADFEVPNMQFAVEFYWWTGQARLQVMSSNWLSLQQRAGQAGRLTFNLDNIDAWSSNRATIVGNGEVGGFFMELEGAEARSVTSRLASGRILEIAAEGRTLGSYPLENSAEAMVQLERCVAFMRASDRSDPFARQR